MTKLEALRSMTEVVADTGDIEAIDVQNGGAIATPTVGQVPQSNRNIDRIVVQSYLPCVDSVRQCLQQFI